MPLSPAELAAMPRTTPTAQAEAAYNAHRAPRDRADGELPRSRDVYRKLDAKLLHDLARRAHHDRIDAETGGDRAREIAEILVGDLDRRFPPADMAVLERYVLASSHGQATVTCRDHGTARIPLSPPRALPLGAAHFSARVGDAEPPAHVPAEALPYFDRLATLRDERVALPIIGAWPEAYRKQHGRFPRWEEIEHQFPLFGEWMTAQRRAAA